MRGTPRALVIGAGIGGIAAAGRLARLGFHVQVLEKNETPGGRCGRLTRDGHRFDIGPTLFLMPEVFKQTYAALGERMQDHLNLHRIDPTYRIHFQDGTQLPLTADLNLMQSQLEAIDPGSFGGYLRFLSEGERHYRLSLEHFVGRNFNSLLDYFSLRNLPLLVQLRALVKHYDRVSHYFKHPYLRAAFSFQNMYLGLSPYDAPATYSLLQYTELADGVWFPEGGMYRVIESLVSIAKGLGVRFHFGAPVSSIETSADRATGVVLEDGRRLEAELILANADLPYVYRHLLKDEREAKRLDRMKYTCSAIMFYWGVDRIYPHLGHHNVFLADEYKASFDQIFIDHDLPAEPSFYVHAPARTDPSAAPEGQDTLMVLVPTGHINERNPQEWAELAARARRAVLDRLTRIGIRDLEEHIKFEVRYTPEDWKRNFNLAKGAAFGLSHNFTQVGYLRPRNRHPRLRNLYFAGASTHPGTGLPIVLLSAQLACERIAETFGLRSAFNPPDQARPERKPTVQSLES